VIGRDDQAAVEAALGSAIADMKPVSGGCISPAWQVILRDGRRCFLKAAPDGAAADLFRHEASALERIAATRSVRVPAVLAREPAWLALEWLEPGAAPAGAWRALGRALAGMHGNTADRFGLDHDNYIGSLPQDNTPASAWAVFWGERRLRPQLERAAHRLGSGTVRRFEELLDGLDERLAVAEDDGASLLHGDLWGGNVHMTRAGPALIDPSCYYGHREVDLAMAALFGGFPPEFHEAYAAEWPLAQDAEARRAIYQLYYLLVHVNLFGGSYVQSTERTLRKALA
jgi:fructosamine-3-kinase